MPLTTAYTLQVLPMASVFMMKAFDAMTLCSGTPFLLSWKVTGVRQVEPQAVHSHPCKARYTR